MTLRFVACQNVLVSGEVCIVVWWIPYTCRIYFHRENKNRQNGECQRSVLARNAFTVVSVVLRM